MKQYIIIDLEYGTKLILQEYELCEVDRNHFREVESTGLSVQVDTLCYEIMYYQ